MQGDPKVIEVLRFAIAQEAHLNAQYRSDWRVLKFAGLKKLANVAHGFGDDAHRWLKKVQDRVLLLEGDIGYTPGPVIEVKSANSPVVSLFKAELALEMGIVKPYEQAIQTCMTALDDTSRNLFEHLLKWHQEGEKKQIGHVLWLEQQLRLIAAIGESEYIAEQL